MICKERNPSEHLAIDGLSAAAAAAAAQLTAYLQRAFGDDPAVWVFNDLRFRSDEDRVVQVDHLILHRSGFIVIDSTSVAAAVRIQPNGDWERQWDNHWEPLPSPLHQLERQEEFLRLALQAYRDQLLWKILFSHMELVFSSVPFERLVAIADGGSLTPPEACPEALPAALVPERVRAIVSRHQQARGLFNLENLTHLSNDGLCNFKDVELEAMRDWFVVHHYPEALQRERAAQRQRASAPPAPEST